MNLHELQKVLRAVEPAAVLVAPRVLESIARQTWKLSGLLWSTPHRRTFIVDRQTLFRHVDQEELVLGPDELLTAATVILLSWPTGEVFQDEPTDALLLKYWQRLFHASIHLTLENQLTEGKLTPADLRARIVQIGPTQFEEIRTVLTQDEYLPPNADDRMVFIEFAAIFLEQYYFTSSLLQSTFPGLRDPEAIRHMLERDVDGKSLFHRTRLAGAADPVVKTVTGSQEAHEYYWKLISTSERATQTGNVVLAAIQKRRAARVAPPALAHDTMQAAQADIYGLTARLRHALELSEEEAGEWQQDLLTLLDKADQGTHPPEAALLYDLQRVCLDNEQDIFALDLVEWLLSMGRRPIKRPLPSQRLVRLSRHLRSASQRLTMARLSDSDRRHLAGLLQTAQTRCENRLRDRFRPVFVTALEDVGLAPKSPPERTAFAKMVEEFLDRILVYGFLTFSDLRDTLSRNLLKLPDLSEPNDFIRGDPLLRLDRRLATLLDGVYRRSEFYQRWLARFTSLNFGTGMGRLLTQYVTLPFGMAFLFLAAFDIFFLQHFNLSILPLEKPRLDPTLSWMATPLPAEKLPPLQALFWIDTTRLREKVPWVPVSVFGASSAGLAAQPLGALSTILPDPRIDERFSWYRFFTIFLPLWLPPGFFFLGLLHSPKLRKQSMEWLQGVWRPTRRVLLDGPLWLIRNPELKKLAKTWSFQLFFNYVLKPAPFIALFIWVLSALGDFNVPEPLKNGKNIIVGSICFFFAVVSYAHADELWNALAHLLVSMVDSIRAGLLPNFFNWILAIFKKIIHFVEALLFTVDEWLRFRKGDSQFAMMVRAILTVLWFPFSYLARLNMVVLLEPALNPVKLPVCLIAAKFWYPLTVAFLPGLSGNYLIGGIVYYVWYMFPDVFGFFFWEIRENWCLYRANRSEQLEPIVMGPHGETLPKLLQPGFHAGTIPKLFARLRLAEHEAYRTGNWSGVRSCQAALEQVEEAVRLFVDRDFVALLEQDPHWQKQELSVGRVVLATNQIRVELLYPRLGETPAVLEFENRSGWILAGFGASGWLSQLTPLQVRPLHNALATLYKLAGVEVVREQLLACLPSQLSALDLAPQGLIYRPDGRPAPGVIYPLEVPAEIIVPRLAEGVASQSWPPLQSRKILFSQIPVTWEECNHSWQNGATQGNGQMLAGEVALLPEENRNRTS